MNKIVIQDCKSDKKKLRLYVYREFETSSCRRSRRIPNTRYHTSIRLVPIVTRTSTEQYSTVVAKDYMLYPLCASMEQQCCLQKYVGEIESLSTVPRVYLHYR